MILIDSDIFIDNLRRIEKSKEYFEKLLEKQEKFYFSVITEAELLSGQECNNNGKLNKVIALLSLGHKLEISNPIAKIAGKIRRENGLTLDDSFIGATALINNFTLVTRNTSDFEKIKELKIKVPY